MSGSSTVDDRVVEMTFQNSSFVNDVQKTITALGLLKSKLNGLKGSADGINELDNAGKNFSLSNIAEGVDTLKSKFSAMGIIGISVLSSLVGKAVNAGLSIAKSLTIDPIKQGLDVYETKINAIQVILANTSAEGTKLPQVTAALNELNKYANLTVYNFGQMAQNIGTFTAAGVNLKTSVSSIKGIANLAALSGAGAEQATNAMYQLSQAIAAGRVKLQDWNSVVNAGLGGKVFQNALIQTAKVNGVQIDAILKKNNGFRNSLQTGWLTSKILTQTLSTFTGDLGAAQLKAMGYTAAQTKAIMAQATQAVNSATKIRTITQLQAALREEVATAWSQVWEAIIGNIGTATTLLSAVHNTLENAFTNPVKGLAQLLNSAVALGARDDVIKAFSNGFLALSKILGVVSSAFKEVFPPTTAEDLLKMAFALEKFTGGLIIGNKTAADLKTIFVGLFSVIKIVLDVIGGVGRSIGIMAGSADKAGGGFLHLLANLAQFITNVRKSIESGNALTKFFTILGSVLSLPIKAIGNIIASLGGFGGAIDKAVGSVSPFVNKVGAEFSKLASAITNGIKDGNFQNIVNVLDQLLFGGVLLSIRKFITNLGKGSGEEKTGLFDTIKESFESLTGALKSMQTTLKSATLEKIAIAVALLTVSLLALSFVNVKNLAKALAAITVMFVQLLGAMAVVSKISGSAGILKMGAIGLALNLLATAIVILVGAVAILAQFSWTQLAKGLGAIAILLIELVAATLIMSANSKGLITSAIAMEYMAVALNILASAVGKLGKLDFKTLGKGIGAIAAILLIVGLFNNFGGKGLIATAAAMLLVGAALNVIAIAIKTLGSLSAGALAKGLIGIAGALLIIAVAMNVMPPTMFVTAASLLLVATALVILSKALTTMGNMSWTEIAKSLIVLAGALIIIAAAMILMTEALPGAAALLVVAAAITILTPALVAFSQLSWEGIAKALVTLAGVFLVIAAAGILLTPLIPTLLGLGLAITLLGVGILAAGAGVALFAVGLTALALAVTASGVAILSFVGSILGLIPLALKELGLGIIAFANVIGQGGPAITNAIAALLTALLNAIIKIVPLAVKAFSAILDAILAIIPKYEPKLTVLFGNLILNLLETIAVYYPRFIVAGLHLIENLLNGIANNIPKIAAAAVHVVVAFIDAVVASELAIAKAGANAVITFINGIANEIRADAPRLDAAAANLGSAIVSGMTFGLSSKAGGFLGKAEGLAQNAIGIIGKIIGYASPAKAFMPLGASIPDGLGVGVDSTSDKLNAKISGVGTDAVSSMKNALSGLSDVISSGIDVNPTITPVLDLTEAKKGFNSLATLSKSHLISATASTSMATSISAANTAAATAAGLVTTNTKSITLNQYNSSPAALSNAEIYRQTKNQLSVVKGALSPNANVG